MKEPVIIEVTATDETFALTNETKVRAVVVDEKGTRKELQLEQVLGKDGLYTARFVPNQYGEYTVTATGTLAGENLGKQQALFEVKPLFCRVQRCSTECTVTNKPRKYEWWQITIPLTKQANWSIRFRWLRVQPQK